MERASSSSAMCTDFLYVDIVVALKMYRLSLSFGNHVVLRRLSFDDWSKDVGGYFLSHINASYAVYTVSRMTYSNTCPVFAS
jgi:hypothetical protein